MSKLHFFIEFLFILLICTCTIEGLKAQEPTIELNGDSVLVVPIDNAPSKAAYYSMIFPGLGQAYNKSYWKIPIIYGLGATLGYFINFNNNRHILFKNSFFAKTRNLPDQDPFPQRSLRVVTLNKDFFQRNRDLLIILSGLLYALNIVEATVDAHLKDFDLSDDLSVSLRPSSQEFFQQTIMGASISIKFK